MFPIFIPMGGGGFELKKHERYIAGGCMLLTLASVVTLSVGALLDKEIVCMIGFGGIVLAAVILFGRIAIDLIRDKR